MVGSVKTEATWASSLGVQAAGKPDTSATAAFSKVLDQMKTDRISTSDAKSEDEKKISVVSRTMSDGSTVVMVMLGMKIVAERKFGGSAKGEKDAKLVDMKTDVVGKLGEKGCTLEKTSAALATAADAQSAVANAISAALGSAGFFVAMQ
jgi:hypothetical protein